MKQLFEFRLLERYAELFLPATEGRSIARNSIRVVQFELNDPRLAQLREIKLRANAESNESPFFGWRMLHRYSEDELHSAPALQVVHIRVADFSAEECGTRYSDEATCEVCGFGRQQIGELRIDAARLPSKVDICKALGGEILVSERLASLAARSELKGLHFAKVLDKQGKAEERWRQWKIVSESAVVAPTRSGVSPIEPDELGRFRCPFGHVVGLNQLSELFVDRVALDKDAFSTVQAFGERVGVLNPERPVLVSHEFRAWVMKHSLLGFHFDAVRTPG